MCPVPEIAGGHIWTLQIEAVVTLKQSFHAVVCFRCNYNAVRGASWKVFAPAKEESIELVRFV